MLESEPEIFYSGDLPKSSEVDRILFDSLSPEIFLPLQINQDNNVNLLARYTGAAIEALSIDGSQEGIDFVVDFFRNASIGSYETTGLVDKPLLLTAYDIAIRYRSSENFSQRLLDHELDVCWAIYASETSNKLLNRLLSDEQIIDMADRFTCNQESNTTGSQQHVQFIDIAKKNFVKPDTLRVIDRAFARHKTINPLPSQIFIHH